MTIHRTVNAAFLELLSRIELNPTRVELASERYHAVKNQIENALPDKFVKQVGSFQRKTKIRPQNPDEPFDIDAIVSFGSFSEYAPSGQGVSPRDALATVRSALVEDGTYKIMRPRTDAPTVVLTYADGFRIELIPCFVDKTGQYNHPGGPDCYVVGTRENIWEPADYDYDALMISELNQGAIVQGNLVPTIKMIKAFIRGQNIGLKSFYVEILCALTIPNLLSHWVDKNLVWGYQHILAGFLKYAPYHMRSLISLLGSYSLPTESGLPEQLLAICRSHFEELGDIALEICAMGDSKEALDLWAEFFGEPFPG